MTTRRTLTHWGAFDVTSSNGVVTDVAALAGDPDPSSITGPIANSAINRVRSPAVRASWLSDGVFANPSGRGIEPMIDVDWTTALDLAATALDRVRSERGNAAIFGGSYGWGSAGRFHHPQSQLKRFLNTIGGFTNGVGTYSHGAAEVVVPATTGVSFGDYLRRCAPPPDFVAATTEAFISLGGFPAHNTAMTSGGEAEHWYRPTLRKAASRGCRFVTVSPTLGKFDKELGSEWLPIRPGTDAALLLALTFHMLDNDPTHFAETAVGHYVSYLNGDADGIPKNADWAAEICGLAVHKILELVELLCNRRSLLNATWSTQRVENGEQTTWALLALGTILGASWEAGSSTTLGYGSMGSVGAPWVTTRPASLPQGRNPVNDHLPVARIADALRNPGKRYSYQGTMGSYPDIDAIYWCGGNPFHHHQDLNQLSEAWNKPRAVIVNEPSWTATARRSDIVFPSTFGFERSDLGGASTGRHLIMMQAAVAAPELARNDYDIFSALAERLGSHAAFTEGRTAEDWIEELYRRTRQHVPELPPFDEFVGSGGATRPSTISTSHAPAGIVEFPQDAVPVGATPHPTWIPPIEWLGTATNEMFHLVSPMPEARLHSQHGGEPDSLPKVRCNPGDLTRLGLTDGQTVRLSNDRGAMHAVIESNDGVAERVVSVDNGYPFRPSPNERRLCTGGNVNCLTADRPTSSWAQASVAHSCLVTMHAIVTC